VSNFEDFKQEIQTELKKMIKKMSNRVNELEARVKGLESKVVSREDFTKEYKELRIELNRQAQYSRKDNLRCFGIREQNNENSKEEVCKVVDGRLNVRIAPADI
jgi:cell division protein FtsB